MRATVQPAEWSIDSLAFLGAAFSEMGVLCSTSPQTSGCTRPPGSAGGNCASGCCTNSQYHTGEVRDCAFLGTLAAPIEGRAGDQAGRDQSRSEVPVSARQRRHKEASAANVPGSCELSGSGERGRMGRARWAERLGFCDSAGGPCRRPVVPHYSTLRYGKKSPCGYLSAHRPGAK